MSLPVVAIVGRPNVGKSSLLNALAGRRISIVAPTPGVTRDRVSAPCEVGHGYAELIDCGGMGLEDADRLTEHVEQQINHALASAELILFVVDAREGVTPLDKHAARRLRRQDKPVLLVANKVDTGELVAELPEVYALGFGEPIAVSAEHSLGITELADAIAAALAAPGDRPPEPVMKLAVVGKRNAGKSTLINALAGSERVIVSETPGTTRDSVDVTIERDGRTFTLIDTAGVRKRRKIRDDIGYYSLHRALRSVRRADVVAFMMDASTPVSQVDKTLGSVVIDELKPVVLVVNKWDLARRRTDPADYGQYLYETFPALRFAPVSLTTATEGVNVEETVDLAEELFAQARTRVTTGRLNEVIREILALRGPSHKSGTKRPKILYATQIATAPPTLVCFVNDPRSFDTNYQRFLLNQLRQRLPFAEVPIRLIFRKRRSPAQGRRKTRS